MRVVDVEIVHAPTVGFASERCGVPLVRDVVVRNRGDEALSGALLEVGLVPELGEAARVAVPEVRPGDEVRLGAIELRLPQETLGDLVVSKPAVVRWRLRPGGGPAEAIASGEAGVDLLAFDEWPGLRAPPAVLAAFVTPGHPVVRSIVRRAAERLRSGAGFDGYAARAPGRVRAAVAAVHDAVQALGLAPADPPPDLVASGGRVRAPDVVLSDRAASPLDATLLVAACLEQAGLHPLPVLTHAHALAAVWLVDDRFPEGLVEDAARLRNLVALGQLLAFDPSPGAAPVPFPEALRRADAALADDAGFRFAIDVRVLRQAGCGPLPPPQLSVPPAVPALPAEAQEIRRVLEEAAAVQPPQTVPARPAVPPDRVAARFRRWQDRLLDLSLRNRLVNFRPAAAGVLPLDVPDLATFEDLLAGGYEFQILGRPDLAGAPPRAAEPPPAPEDEAERRRLREADLAEGTLHSPLPAEQTRSRARNLARAARTALEEGGASVLYVSLGLLRWHESPEGGDERFAPLLLFPVQLACDRAKGRVALRRLPEDPVANVTLVEKARRDHGLDLSALSAPEPDESGVDMAGLLRAAREAIRGVPRWEVLEQAHVGLFTFTKFLMWRDLEENAAALLRNEVVRHIAAGDAASPFRPVAAVQPERLDHDVPPEVLPLVLDADATQTAAIATALSGGSFVLQGPPGTGKSQTIANLIAAAVDAGKTVLFVSEKMAALEVVQRRLESVGLGDFCLELHSHKASKKDVLASFQRAVARAGRKHPRPAWSERSRDLAEARQRLNEYVAVLHGPRPLGLSFYEACDRLHALGDASGVRLPLADVEHRTGEWLRQAREAAGDLAAHAARVEPVAEHPWRAARRAGWSARVEDGLFEALDGTLLAIDQVEAAGAAARAALGLSGAAPAGGQPSPAVGASTAALEDLAHVGRLFAEGPLPAAAVGPSWPADAARARAWIAAKRADAERRAALAVRWRPELLRLDLEPLHARFRRWASAFFLLAFLLLWGARRALRGLALRRLPGNAALAADLAAARTVQADAPALEGEQAWLDRVFGDFWSSEADDPAALEAILARGDEVQAPVSRLRLAPEAIGVLAAIADAATPADRRAAIGERAKDLAAALDALDRGEAVIAHAVAAPPPAAWPLRNDPRHREGLREALATWRANRAAFRPWCFYVEAAARLEGLGLAALAEAHRAGAVRAERLADAGEKSVLRQWTAAVRDAEPLLARFDGTTHDRAVERFVQLDAAHVALAREWILSRLEERLPEVDPAAAESTELGLLLRETRKKSKHLAVRKLLRAIPTLLPRLKPCLLMSPLSVAQYLPADGLPFDLVVFDEASQIGTHDAIAAVARGRQVVIVGDSQQLPPTTFFLRTAEDPDALPHEDDVEELESILDEALARQVPQLMLGWHYRSRHESLIEFSNRRYYGGRLHVFPAARSRVDDLGVTWHHVPAGAYLGGRAGRSACTNPREAEALVEHLVRELRACAPGERSFGVITFSIAQQALIEELLDERRAGDPAIDAHFEPALAEPVFVKNLENVQGDERDEILFSVGYARDEHGRLRMHFGPLSNAGGERRLNVAVTRARRRLRVFSALTHDQIDLSRTASAGAAHLREFLSYAARQGSAPERPAGRAADPRASFEQALHGTLAGRGLATHPQVGCRAFAIDVAVVDPRHPGEYALGLEGDGPNYRSACTARDRERLRPLVLRSLGWRLHRVWSTDWWLDPQGQAERLGRVVDETLAAGRGEE